MASLLVGFSCSLSFPVMAVGEGLPSTGASAVSPSSLGPSGAQPWIQQQQQGDCTLSLGLSPLGFPKRWKGGMTTETFRGKRSLVSFLLRLWESGHLAEEG